MTDQSDRFSPDVDDAAIARFCDIAFGYTEGFVPVRILPETGMSYAHPILKYPAPDRDLPDVLSKMARKAAALSQALYVVPATVAAPGSAKEGEIAETAVLLVDLDVGDIGAKRAHLVRHVGTPTLEVASGGLTPEGQPKLHLYWRLTEAASGTDLGLAIELRGEMAKRADADTSFAKETQPIRVPGSLYFKHNARAAARIIADTLIEYELLELAERIRAMPPYALPPLTGKIDAPAAQRSLERQRLPAEELMKRTIRANTLDGISRYDAISTVAGYLIYKARVGDDSVEAAWERLRAYNETGLQPPWPERRLRRSFDRLLTKDRRTNVAAWNRAADDSESNDAPQASDDALAIAFVEQHGEDWLVVPVFGQWLRWTGNWWEEDRTDAHREVIRLVCRSKAPLDKLSEARRVASSKTILAVERVLNSDPELTVNPESLDAEVMEFNCAGGIVDLRAGNLLEHCRSALMTRVSPATPVPGCPRWLAFMDEITGGDAVLASYLQRFCGYCLTGSTKEHVFLFLHGEGANGKSVFLQTVAAVLGDYAVTASTETFMSSRFDRHASELAQFRGARLVVVPETEPDRTWAESRIKGITGGDAVRARLLYANSFEYLPTFKLVVAGNHRPAFNDLGEAMRRRLHLVPFRNVIPAERRDRDLPTKLLAERDGILAWMLEGLMSWQDRGLDPPEEVSAASRDYFIDEDQLGEWLESQCDVGPALRATTASLFDSWRQFADRGNIPAGSRKSFATSLVGRGFVAGRSGRQRFWTGLRLCGGGEVT